MKNEEMRYFILIPNKADYDQLCRLIIRAPNKTTAEAIANKHSVPHNTEWSFDQQKWKAYDINDESIYDCPEDGVVLSITM